MTASGLVSLQGCDSANYWDCFDLRDRSGERNHRVFGNRNIGQLQLTNLQIPGCLGSSDSYCIVQRWYARTNLPLGDPEVNLRFMRWAENAVVGLIDGESRIRWRSPLADLILRRPRAGDEPRATRMVDGDPWPIVFAPRHHMSVSVDEFRDHDDVYWTARNSHEFGDYPDSIPRVWIHFEGIHPPRRARNLTRLVEQIVGLVIDRGQERRSTEEKIAAWVLGIAKATGDSAVEAVADGILAGRASSEQHVAPPAPVPPEPGGASGAQGTPGDARAFGGYPE